LRNLEKINCCFGGTAAVIKLFNQVMGRVERTTLLDLATGYGDHPRTLAQLAKKKGMALTVVAVDRQWATLRLAQEASPSQHSIRYVQADIRQLPFKDKSVDAVFCTLALHHFSAIDAGCILVEMQRLARRAAVALDLEGGRWTSWAIYWLTLVWMREPMTRHDARLSARRAFSAIELKKLAGTAGWSRFWHRRYPLFRHAIGWEPS
jgi:ubiquinone/menaquinone biosynthesis C-methylase UbiE